MFCTNCGKEIPDEANFCRYCGSPVTFRKPVAEVKQPVEIKEEIQREEISVPKAEIHEELAEAEREMDMAMEIEKIIEASGEEPTCEAKEEETPEVCPAVTYKEPEIPAEQQKPKKKISPMIWIIAGVGILLIIAVIIIITLLGKISKVNSNAIPQGNNDYNNEYISEAEVEYGIETENEYETPVFTDFPSLSNYYDDFIESDTFDDSTPLGEGEILYMGEAYYEDIGQCYVSFVLSEDRKSLKNFIVYMIDLSLVVEGNGRSYDLSSITSIRNNYNSLVEYTEDYCEILLGESSLYEFVLDTVDYEYALGTLDFMFKYYPPMSAGSAPSPVTVDLGVSDVYFDPVRIG